MAADNDCIVIFMDLVLLMGWVKSTKFLFALSETLTDVENFFIHTSLLVPEYGDIVKIPETGIGMPHTLDILTQIDCYMY